MWAPRSAQRGWGPCTPSRVHISDVLSATPRLTALPGGTNPSDIRISAGRVRLLARHSVADEVVRRRLRRRGHRRALSRGFGRLATPSSRPTIKSRQSSPANCLASSAGRPVSSPVAWAWAMILRKAARLASRPVESRARATSGAWTASAIASRNTPMMDRLPRGRASSRKKPVPALGSHDHAPRAGEQAPPVAWRARGCR